MRVPITLKLFLSFSLIMLLSFGPAYWYLRSHLHDQIVGAVQADCRQQAQHVADASLRRTLIFLHRAAGAAASLVLLLSLVASQYGARRLIRLRLAAQAYARGEYAHALPAGTPDEIGELGQSMVALARRVQLVMVSHSAEVAQRAGLIRACPLPALLLSPELEREEINVLFRKAAAIEPAHEDERIRVLCDTPEFAAARLVALESGQPQSLRLHLPWMRDGLSGVLCALPAAGGHAGWVLYIEQRRDDQHGDWRDPLVRSRHLALRQVDALIEVLSQLAAVDPGRPVSTPLRARLIELHAAADVLQPAEPPPPATVATVDLSQLLPRLLEQVQPLAAEGRIDVRTEVPAVPVRIADAQGFTARVLRVLLVRAISAARTARERNGEARGVVSLHVHEESTCVQLQLSGPIAEVPYADLDQLLGTIGGGIGPQPDPCAQVPELAAAERVPGSHSTPADLFMQVRRA